MPKSKIIKDLVNKTTSLEITLKRLLVLANDINNVEIKKWVSQEIYGYDQKSSLPDYRILKGCNLKFTGINGRYKVDNMPLHLGWLSKQTIEKLSKNEIRMPVREIEKLSNSKDILSTDVTYLAGEVLRNTKNGFGIGVQCASIIQWFAPSQFENIAIAIEKILLDILLELENKFGSLDDMDIGLEKINRRNRKELMSNIDIILNNNLVTGKKIKIVGSSLNGSNNSVENINSNKHTNIKSDNSNASKQNNIDVAFNSNHKKNLISRLLNLFRRK